MRKDKLLLCALFLGLMVPGLLFAQSGTVAGKIVSTTGEALPGANVVVQIAGLTLGTATDANGNYTITNVPAGNQKITARFVGYRSEIKEVNVAVARITEVNFTLAPTVLQLDEVVVTGAGVAGERLKLGNTVATIHVGNLQEAPVSNISEILQGRVAGVVGLPLGGLVGTGAQIRIRGNVSLSQSNEPLVYVDGIRVDNGGGFAGVTAGGSGSPSRLDDINPAAIERIEILKGAAATTLYGTQANAGLIQIFTKQGAQTAPKFDFEIQQSVLEYPDAWKPAVGFARDSATAARMSIIFGETIRPFQLVEKDNMSGLIGTGYGQTYSATVSGGQTGLSYFASMRFNDVDGPFDPKPEAFYGETNLGGAKDRTRRGQFSGNINVIPSDRLRIRLSSQYTFASQETIENNNNIYSPLTLGQFGRPDRATKLGVAGGIRNNYQGTAAFATVREGLQQETKDRTDHGNVSLSASYNLTNEIALDATVGLDYTSQRSTNFSPFGWNVDLLTTASTSGALGLGTRQKQEWTIDSKVIWNTDLMQDIRSNLIVGIQGFQTIENGSGGAGTTFPGVGIEILNAGLTQTSYSYFSDVIQAGVLAQEQLSYSDYLFLTLGVRFDANSAFGTAFKTATYPKASVSFLPLKAFDQAIPYMSTLRVRAAIGQSGQQPGAFDKLTTFVAFRSADGSGLAPGNLGNQSLKPEVATEWEVGAESGFFEDRLGLEVVYWKRVVKDALVNRSFPPSGGFYRVQLDNIGQLDANGVDVSLTWNVIRSEDLSVNLFGNGAYLKETVTSLGGAPALKTGGAYSRYRNFIKEGYAPGSYFGPKLAGFASPIDINQDGIPDSQQELLAYFSVPRDPSAWATRLMLLGADGAPMAGGRVYLEHYLGKPTPDWQGAFGFNISFLKSFRLNSLFEYKTGNFTVHNLTDAFRRAHPTIGRNIRKSSEVEVILLNPASTPEQRVAAAQKWAKEVMALAPYDGLNEMEKGDFIRWRELSLTYDLPSEFVTWFGVRSGSVSVAGRNIALWTKYSGTDPENSAVGRGDIYDGAFERNFLIGVDAFGIAIPRQFVFSLRFGM